VHCICADDDGVDASVFETFCGVDHEGFGLGPFAEELAGYNVVEVEGVDCATGGVVASECGADAVVDGCVVRRGGFPSQAADKPEDFHCRNRSRRSSGSSGNRSGNCLVRNRTECGLGGDGADCRGYMPIAWQI